MEFPLSVVAPLITGESPTISEGWGWTCCVRVSTSLPLVVLVEEFVHLWGFSPSRRRGALLRRARTVAALVAGAREGAQQVCSVVLALLVLLVRSAVSCIIGTWRFW